jgi:S-phase kinase-associated protein 1
MASETTLEEKDKPLEEVKSSDKVEEQGGLDDGDGDDLVKIKSSDDKLFEISKKSARLSNLIDTVLKGDKDASEIEVQKVEGTILEMIVEYLKHHNGKSPDDLQCPVRSVDMKQICTDQWDAEFIDKHDKKTVFEIILAANYMDIKSLLHLGCAKIATEIKKLDQKEIHRIIEEEEKWRKEHGQLDQDDVKQDDNNKSNNNANNEEVKDNKDTK